MTQRIYTKTGDAGQTGLFGGGRVSKASARVEAYGAVDELNAAIGWSRTTGLEPDLDALLGDAQSDLFTVGAHLATPAGRGKAASHLPGLPGQRIASWETWIDRADAELPDLETFILPGGSPGAASLHLCRTVCRRAERRVVALAATEPVDPVIIMLLNRLSDLLFVAARRENRGRGIEDIRWTAR